ncbi:SRPBCC family protein [Pseudaestuariivita sp.]|uniref:SRPBCC family protein n=1 Tax=Pseudaestuariivita sp. TaxID=2211669 RepID=UPI004057CC1C
MKFSAKEDIDAPIDAVFAMLSDFEGLEKAAKKRGIKVSRDGEEPQAGTCWHMDFSFRGKPREADLTLERFDAPNTLWFTSDSSGLGGEGGIELVELSRTQTRMATEVTVTANNLSARLLLQSLKLAKSNLNKRYKMRVGEFGKYLEARYKDERG